MSDAMSARRSSYGDPFGQPDDPLKIHVEFYSRMVPEEDGYVKRDYLKLRHIGDKTYELNQPASEAYQRRFSKQWAAYQSGQTIERTGAPLALLFPGNPEIIKNLEDQDIFVVEQLAALNDSAIQGLGLGGRQFSDAAKAYLEKSADKRHKSQQAQIDELVAELASLKGTKR